MYCYGYPRRYGVRRSDCCGRKQDEGRNFAEKYTEATRKALEDDLADAKAAKDNTALSVEEVKWIVES